MRIALVQIWAGYAAAALNGALAAASAENGYHNDDAKLASRCADLADAMLAETLKRVDDMVAPATGQDLRAEGSSNG